jgi:glycosyltransferase involved in cell wall biosynthesis
MLRGEEGNQSRGLDELIAWLQKQEKPDVICLSNALLIGLVRRLRTELHAPVVCMLQGEDGFLDALPASHRAACWQTLAQRAAEVDLFVSPSRYFGDLMAERLGLGPGRVRVVHNGINLDGYSAAPATPPAPPVLGYFARMCKEKGLDTLVDAYLLLRQRDRVKGLKLKVGGGCGPADAPFVESLRERLRAKGVAADAEFHPNVERAKKLEFLRSLSVFSVPARYAEAFGLYVIEALAAGVPVVQPRSAAFPELLEATGGGVLCAPENPESLADAIENLLLEPSRLRAFRDAGRRSVFERFSAPAMAQRTLEAFAEATSAREPAAPMPSATGAR